MELVLLLSSAQKLSGCGQILEVLETVCPISTWVGAVELGEMLTGLACIIRWYCCASTDTTPALVSSEVEYIVGKLGNSRPVEEFDSVIIVIMTC